tara:strand:- start:271 stop:663 length:393 start_codon:yes stop_codon:yes gene_type:complete
MTQNFKKSEFECKCGCEMPLDIYMNLNLVAKQLEILRKHFDEPIRINSAYRCAAHNKKVGGSLRSQHKLGTATDIVVRGLHSHDVFDEIEKLRKEGKITEGGLGKYDSFTHFDLRKNRARWDNTFAGRHK